MCSGHHYSRRDFLRISASTAAGAVLAGCSGLSVAKPAATAEPAIKTGNAALSRLLEGNKRYAAYKSTDVNETKARRAEVAKGQKPFATILGCVDSRVPPELVFDRGLGDLFVIRTAGQVVDKAVLGSLEFGVAELKIPLLMVLGHEKCGAINATIEAVEKNAKAEAEIAYLVENLRPVVEKAKERTGDKLDNAVRVNVEMAVSTLRSLPFFAEFIHKGELRIVGARYDLDSGLVEVTVP